MTRHRKYYITGSTKTPVKGGFLPCFFRKNAPTGLRADIIAQITDEIYKQTVNYRTKKGVNFRKSAETSRNETPRYSPRKAPAAPPPWRWA